MRRLLLIFSIVILSFYSCKAQNDSKKVKFVIPKDSFILDSVSLIMKEKVFKVITLEKNELKNKDNVQHNSNPIIILEKEGKQFNKIMQNNKLVFKYDDNCPADGYGSIVAKNNYFTIEQISCAGFQFVNSYTTFKIDDTSGAINLHKYGEEYTDRSNPDKKIPSKTWSKKDFGEVKFENVSDQFLLKLRQSKPKK
jgi:hypothetical protein